MEHCKMLLNEYRLNPARKQDQEVIVKQMEQFFFGEGSSRPAEYVPPAHCAHSDSGRARVEGERGAGRAICGGRAAAWGRLLIDYLWPVSGSQFITS